MNGSKRIKNIVEELRYYARRDTSTVAESVDINKIIKSALSLLSNMIKKSTDNFITQFEDNLPHISGNSQKIEQVIINLMENACQALPDKSKGIKLISKYRRETREILITIQDEGIGISSESLKHITDPFFTTKREKGGTGLGLSISQNIINMHGGTLSFYSELGAGTTAIITFPELTKKED